MAVKKNPHKLPLKKNAFDAQAIIHNATIDMNFRAWLLILNSFANFSEATSDRMCQLWADVNAYGVCVRSCEDILAEKQYIETITGMKLPFEQLSCKNITTQGALNRFIRKVEQNAFSTALSIIAKPIVNNQLLPEDDIKILFKRALLTNEELEDKHIKIRDLQLVLEEEFALSLHISNGTVYLSKIVPTPESLSHRPARILPPL